MAEITTGMRPSGVSSGIDGAVGDRLKQRSIHECFEEQVALNPDAVALEFGDSTVTYSTLSKMSNHVCAVLLSSGLVPESCVAVCVPRSVELIAALLGILKAGGAYLPLDLSLPAQRLRFMVADASAHFVLGSSEQRSVVSELLPGAQFIDVQTLPPAPPLPVDSAVTDRNLAYVLYTSGSTGTPKGVLIEHRSVVRLVRNTNYVSFAPNDVFLQFAPLSFDASTFEIWAPLLNGCRLAIAPARDLSLTEIEEVITRHRVSTLWLTAGLLNALVDERPASFRDVRQLLAGGDVLSPAHVRKALLAMRDGCVINGYGPTENTTFTCCYRVTSNSEFDDNIPIGQPISRTTVRILNSNLEPTPVGEYGELFLGGDGLCRGYLNRPELDQERFISDPFEGSGDARLYRSGDLGRYLPSGDIEFGGRIDSQLKLRGYRIEPGEIEFAASQCPGIARAAVVAVRNQSGDKSLFCFYVVAPDATITAEELRLALQGALPLYMVPAHFRQLEIIPLTVNGKVDRALLAELGSQAISTRAAISEELHDIEPALLEMFRAVLGTEDVSLDDDFFAVGGHSLAAARLFAKIEERFGAKLPLATMFRAPTIRKLAAVVRDRTASEEWSPLVAIRAEGTRRPLFLVHAIGGNVLNYKQLDAYLPADQPIYAFQAAGLKDNRGSDITIEEMAFTYITALRSIQPEGPYHLGGFSAGGVVAYEMAQQLKRQGEQVGPLLLFDSCVTPSVAAYLRSRNYRMAALRGFQIAFWNFHYLLRSNPLSFVKQKAHNFRMNIRILSYQLKSESKAVVRRDAAAGSLTIEESFIKALEQYSPESYSGPVVLFRTSDSDYYNRDAALGWSQLIPTGMEIVDIGGDHDTMFVLPQVKLLASEITRHLDHGLDAAGWNNPNQSGQQANSSQSNGQTHMRDSLSCG